jgi:hypothetical protein
MANSRENQRKAEAQFHKTIKKAQEAMIIARWFCARCELWNRSKCKTKEARACHASELP